MSLEIAIARAAKALRLSAETHKRLARAHRIRARACMSELEVLRAECARLGIKFVTGEEENETHGRQKN